MSAHTQVVAALADYVAEAQAKEGWSVEAPTGGNMVIFRTPADEWIKVPLRPGERLFKTFERKINRAGLTRGAMKQPRVAAARQATKAAAAAVDHLDEDRRQRLIGYAASPQMKAPDGRYYCPECANEGREFSSAAPQGLGSHRFRAHGVTGTARNRPEQAEPLAATRNNYRPPVTTMRPADTASHMPSVPQAQSDDALADVAVAWDMLGEAIRKALSTADPVAFTTLKTERDDALNRLSDAVRLGEQAAEAGQQAGVMLAEIRKAVDELPMTKAFAAITEIIGRG